MFHSPKNQMPRQSLFTPIEAGHPAWQPDSTAPRCTRCQIAFSFFKRRHHCRSCGKIFCDPCSSRKIDQHRVCTACFDTLQQLEQKVAQENARLEKEGLYANSMTLRAPAARRKAPVHLSPSLPFHHHVHTQSASAVTPTRRKAFTDVPSVPVRPAIETRGLPARPVHLSPNLPYFPPVPIATVSTASAPVALPLSRRKAFSTEDAAAVTPVANSVWNPHHAITQGKLLPNVALEDEEDHPLYSQDWLLEILEAFGYPQSAGFCFGVTTSFIAHSLNNQLPLFFQTINYIQENWTTTPQGDQLHKHTLVQLKKAYSNTSVKDVSAMSAARSRFHITEAQYQAARRVINAIQGFFDEIVLNQKEAGQDALHQLNYTYSREKPPYLATQEVLFSGTREMLKVYLASLIEMLTSKTNSETDTQICFSLSGFSHAIGLAYLRKPAKAPQLILADPNFLFKQRPMKLEEVVDCICHAQSFCLPKNPSLVLFSIRAFVLDQTRLRAEHQAIATQNFYGVLQKLDTYLRGLDDLDPQNNLVWSQIKDSDLLRKVAVQQNDFVKMKTLIQGASDQNKALDHSILWCIVLQKTELLDRIIQGKKLPSSFPQGKTYLHLAAEAGVSLEIIKRLVPFYLNNRDQSGRTALQYAQENSHDHIAAFLRQAGAL